MSNLKRTKLGSTLQSEPSRPSVLAPGNVSLGDENKPEITSGSPDLQLASFDVLEAEIVKLQNHLEAEISKFDQLGKDLAHAQNSIQSMLQKHRPN